MDGTAVYYLYSGNRTCHDERQALTRKREGRGEDDR